MIEVGKIVWMFFLKDPEQNGSNVIIKGMYWDKIWIQHEQTGTDEIIDIADIGFKNPIPGEPPNHNFIARDGTNTWLFWNAEEGFWYECSDPTTPITQQVTEEETQAHKSERLKTLH